MARRQLDLIRESNPNFRKSLDQIWERFRDQDGGTAAVNESVLNLARGDIPLEGLGGSEEDFTQWAQLEAIILAELRPAYFVRDDKIILRDSPVDEDADLLATITANRDDLESISRSVGRVDLFNHFTHSYAGTGWLIDDDIVVTNRHVARVFAMQNSFGEFDFKIGTFGERMDARIDYVRQHDTSGIRRRADVFDVIYIAEDSQPDMAFLRVDNIGGIEPLRLQETPVAVGTKVAAVGYPASDGGRNDPVLMEKLFQGIYDVKRFAPGLVTDRQNSDVIFTTDYTSLGGNSGSPVLDLESGNAVGLHFAGAFRDANFAVASDVVAAARARLKSSVFTDQGALAAELTEDPVTAPGDVADRQGYDPNFLGDDVLAVQLPDPGRWQDDIAEVDGDADNVLKYTHFSVVQSVSRRLPLYTAVNIDGERTFSLKRKGTWKTDGRLSQDDQIGNVLYKFNPLDRGHLVRRKDPGWGDSREEAQRAEIDTFHYTNSVPQHKDLNQRDWVNLEDHILESSETHGFKASVFTGPVFREDDKTLKRQPGAEDVRIPEEFWKIVVMLNEDTRELSATGYTLTQGQMIRDLTEAAFIFGEFETFQVQIAKIEKETGLDFGSLRESDPLGAAIDTEAPFGDVVHRISGSEGFVLTKSG